ncbi:Calpain isoform 2 [Schistosoma japonicum]|uniref:Calpain isoform 2 n=1 Tax=Schistosoma japonicum TaxID=6182 RepID=A0A4Z2CQA6_SCHJA|nr:Calpain isoform 2 [Schistosoma japonicum]
MDMINDYLLDFDFDNKVHLRHKKHNNENETECHGIPQNYKDILQPNVCGKRLQLNSKIPWSITPKGYAKLHEKLTLICIPQSSGKDSSIVDRVYKKIFFENSSSGINGYTSSSSSKSETAYPDPTTVGLMKISEYETIGTKITEVRELYEDSSFPANDTSIGNLPEVLGKVEWKRPKDINSCAVFCARSFSRFDVDQGALGDCWFNAVLATITKYPSLMRNIIPSNQNLSGANYLGAVKFNFWRFGQWVEVVIDDRLPVLKGTNKLVFMHSTDGTEFWSSLLEKAYAKLCGSYGHLTGGFQSEAMEDFTGGICQTIMLNSKYRPPNLLHMMKIYTKTCCILGADIGGEKNKKREELGLVGSHAYSLTGFGKVKYKGNEMHLVRLRNPWGQHEWKGAWSDNSPEWKDVRSSDKKELNYKQREDGEFWMSYEDFVKYFSLLEVCHLGLASLDYKDDIDKKRRFEEIGFVGKWVANVNAGGSINYYESFCMNPQYVFTVGTDPISKDNKTTIIVGIMQEHRRFLYGGDYLPIGFELFEVSNSQKSRLTSADLSCRKPLLSTDYIPRREVTLEARVFPGTFIIVPTTYNPNEEAEFLLRVFSSAKMTQSELDEENAYQGFPRETMESLQHTMLKEFTKLESKFMKFCNPITETISSIELSSILNHNDHKDNIYGFLEFNNSLCSCLIASASTNLTGQIDLEEFLNLFVSIKGWSLAFKKYDDRRGCVKSAKLRDLLRNAGYTVSNRVYSALAHRYVDLKSGRINYENFLYCMANVKQAFEVVVYHPKSEKDILMFSIEDME